ncbi:PucR family transcriptional regulator [Bacillus salipaludis]|uniref:PucR family transcriptional regulator n=1 Tax=Bacillus salipaludis TaxID=2547811 RepID=UPI002E247298|nr:PucR family transcriptional regulator ligand-binding domain-containing protein [Bacillus salipaludis]
MITVKEALQLPQLSSVTVRSGQKGLYRRVRWAHTFEYDDVKHFLEGGELLLTSGQSWPKEKELEDKLLEGYLRYQISGILFATGRYLTECPPAALEFGEKYAIPVIEAPYHVPFVKITHAIHIEIMNRKIRKRELAAQLPTILIEKLEKTNSRLEVCRVLSEYLKCPVVITDTNNQMLEQVVPRETGINLPRILGHLIPIFQERLSDNPIEDRPMEPEVQVISVQTKTTTDAFVVPLLLEGDFLGALWLLNLGEGLTEEHAHILEFTVALLIDRVLNNREQELEKRHLRLDVLEFLIGNSEAAPIIVEEKIKELGLEPRANWMAGLIHPCESILSHREAEMEMMLDECKRWIEETDGIYGLCEIYENQLVLFISFSVGQNEIEQKLKRLQNSLKNTNTQVAPVLVLGEIKQHVLSLAESYREAKALAPMVLYKSQSEGAYFADRLRRELIMYGGMSSDKAQELRNLIIPKELLSERGFILFETLKCLASLEYNRESAAKALHIHRNTLRYRIERIEELLQDSLSSTSCQFWIKVALDLESLTNQSSSNKTLNTSLYR